MKDQLTNVTLKPIDKRPITINKNETSFIKNTNNLQLAIQQRREKLTKNQVDSDESDNDWSDDD
jgi:hypothetical protein